MDRIRDFFNGVKKEISRVRWPNKNYMIKYSIAVIVLAVCLSLFFYGIDAISALLHGWGK